MSNGVIYKSIIKPYCEHLERTAIPKWLGPNAITTMGFGSFAVAFMYSQHTIVFGLGWLGYIIADNLDGVVARKRQQSSLLGARLDHGVDALVAAGTARILLGDVFGAIGAAPTGIAIYAWGVGLVNMSYYLCADTGILLSYGSASSGISIDEINVSILVLRCMHLIFWREAPFGMLDDALLLTGVHGLGLVLLLAMVAMRVLSPVYQHTFVSPRALLSYSLSALPFWIYRAAEDAAGGLLSAAMLLSSIVLSVTAMHPSKMHEI